MKKLVNDPADVVREALQGLAAAHPQLRVDLEHRTVIRGDAPVTGKVGLVSGGGSGHEPLHTGFVGPGMLDAACAGEMFTSPVPDQVLAATRAVDGGAGVLHIVKNYTGDVMNFEMAAELAAAEGIAVDSVVVDDDVAVRDSTWTAGRRGVGLTVLLEKIVGAAAEQGRDLAACADLARRVNASGRSMGAALSSCTVPAAGRPTFDLPDDQMELGVGIHGEPGRERVPLAPASEVARMLVEPILDDLDFSGPPASSASAASGARNHREHRDHSDSSAHSDNSAHSDDSAGVICFVNGLGATPLIELYLMYGEVGSLLERAGVRIARSLVGPYITSLDMAGCSVTLLRADQDMLALWDAPVNTPGLRWGV